MSAYDKIARLYDPWSRSVVEDVSFYVAEADGCFKQERWNVFWCGLEDFAQIEACVEHCRHRVPTLRERQVEA